ncbi:reverse transcriptase domain-containing protein [Tanacetum coccineum]
MVKKSDGSWRMCVETSLTLTSMSQRLLSLPAIRLNVESLCGYPSSASLTHTRGITIQLAKDDKEKDSLSHKFQRFLSKSAESHPLFKNTRKCRRRETSVGIQKQKKKLSPQSAAYSSTSHASRTLTRGGVDYTRTAVIRTIFWRFVSSKKEEKHRYLSPQSEVKLPEPWILFMDGSSCMDGSGAGLILTNPEGMEFTYALRFEFTATNNEAEYEALLAGLRIAARMGICNLEANVDSRLVANHVLGEYVGYRRLHGSIIHRQETKSLIQGLDQITIRPKFLEVTTKYSGCLK